MSLGILTFHSQLNYGGVLQALALRDAVEALTHTRTEIIDLWLDPRNASLLGKVNNPNIPFYARWRNKRRIRDRMKCLPAYRLRREKTQKLLRERLHLTATAFKTPKSLAKLPPYDAVLVGSDQVWNPTLVHDAAKNPYLGLTLPPQQRLIAYAASYGVTRLPQELIPLYREGFKRFDAVSIRESSGAELHAAITGDGKPPQVVDPTLLLPKSFWENEIRGREITGEPYILYYWLGIITPDRLDWCRRLAEREGKRVIILASELLNDEIVEAVNAPLEIRFDADPLDFVALCAGADKMVTNSFHGMIFTTIFGGACALLLPGDRNNPSGPARFYDFTERYGFSEACNSWTTVFKTDSLRFADTSKINRERLEADRRASLAFLKEALSGTR